MNFDTLENSSIMLFGKSRALNGDEFAKQLQNHNITLVDRSADDVAAIVEGRLVNPIEQDTLDDLYARKVAPIIGIDPLERWLCSAIDADKLLMSLKLSADRERLMGYLQNPYIPNALFLRLLKLYDWEGAGFFESDENRDVTAALISRFYDNIERNHNVQYANMGIMHLLNQCDDSELIETIALLAPLQRALKEGCDNSTQKILNAIALHPGTSKRVLKQWLQKGGDDIRVLIAMRHDLEPTLQHYLLGLGNPMVDETLSLNPALEHQAALQLLERFPENVARQIGLDEALFERLAATQASALAANPTLTPAMQAQLLEQGEAVQAVLAQNGVIGDTVFETLFANGSETVLSGLIANSQMTAERLQTLFERDGERLAPYIAANPKAGAPLLQQLAASPTLEVLLALAKNPSTPVELLYQFQLDRRLERAVKENPSFGKHIQRDNIGWNV